MLCADLVGLPVHSRGVLVIDLHAVHAEVVCAVVRVFCDDEGQGDVTAGVLRPCFENGQREEIDVIALHDDFLCRRVLSFHCARAYAAELHEVAQHAQLAHQAFGRTALRHRHHLLDAGRKLT